MLTENTIDIDAPPDVVWAVTEDVERWPEWSPTMTAIARVDDGPFALGSAARVKQPGFQEVVWTVTAMDRGRSFTWEGHVVGMHMIATHEVIPVDDRTRSVLRLEMRGLVARLMWPFIRGSVRASLQKENTGLRDRCETTRNKEEEA